MTRPLWILLVTLGYGLAVLLWHRLKLHWARRDGVPLSRFEPFDHRTLLEELRPLYEAGLPGGEATRRRPRGESAALGDPVDWLSTAWDAMDPKRLPDPVARALAALRAGEIASAGAGVTPTQARRIDQALTSLGLHFFLDALYALRLDEAEAILERLPEWTNRKISPRLVDKYRAQIALLRAERSKGRQRRRAAAAARRAILRAGGGEVFAEPGTRALWSHVLLRYFTHGLNLEWRLFQVDRGLRKSLAEHRSAAILYYELAYAAAYRGHSAAAVDHLARALFYAKGDVFYVRAILDAPEVQRIKPVLVEQVRAQFGGGAN